MTKFICMKKVIVLFISALVYFASFGQDVQTLNTRTTPSLVTIKNVDVLGYGFFIDKDLVVTNYQVINKARMGAAKIVMSGNKSFDVVGYVAANEEDDLVILKVSTSKGTPLVLAEKVPVPAEKVYLFSPLENGTMGIVQGSMEAFKDFGGIQLLQLNASAIVSNSGFPVLNADGQVVGVSLPSPIAQANLNFAITAAKVRALYDSRRTTPDELKTLEPPHTIQPDAQPMDERVSQFINQGNARLLAKDYKGAIEKFTMAITLAPGNPDAYVFRGQAKVLQLQYKDALMDFNKAIDLEPNFAEAYDLRGIARAELGDKVGACEDWEKSYELGFNEAFMLVKEFCDVEK